MVSVVMLKQFYFYFEIFSVNKIYILYLLDETSFPEKNSAVKNLLGAVKCSLADFVDISTIGNSYHSELINQLLLITIN
jgi:hypothetical protein